jgi:hypothetical protein
MSFDPLQYHTSKQALRPAPTDYLEFIQKYCFGMFYTIDCIVRRMEFKYIYGYL